MADVRPFRGLRYNPQVVSSLTDVLSPPFDTITPVTQQALYHRSPYNVVRLEAGEQLDSDTAADNRYTRAKGLFERWKMEGVLAQDSSPAFYLLRHDFTHQGKRKQRHGLVAAVRLEDYERGIILPHEHTGEADKEDRLALMEACHANFSPIMGLYRDRESAISDILQRAAESDPVAVANDAGGQDYALWKLDDPRQVAAIREQMDRSHLYIADGHHRYETALKYRELSQPASTAPSDGESAFSFVLMALIEFEDPGLVVLPYHRALSGLHPDLVGLIRERLRDAFEMAPFPNEASMDALVDEVERLGRDGQVMGLLGPQGDGPHILRWKSEKDLAPWGPVASSEPWLLEERILKPALGESLPRHLSYTHDAQEAAAMARSGVGCMAFFLKPFPLDLFERIVNTGQRLPRKSTFFHPKLPTGLVINPLDGTL